MSLLITLQKTKAMKLPQLQFSPSLFASPFLSASPRVRTKSQMKK